MNSPNDIIPEKIIELKIDKELLERIIEIQDLPEKVVVKFLSAAGSLASTNYGKKNLESNEKDS